MRIFFIALQIIVSGCIFSQTFQPVAPPKNIGGVVLFNPQTNNNSPFISLGEHLILKFDELNASYKRYYYTIYRYTHDWKPTEAFRTDYITGFQQDYIRSHQSSFNTLQPYTHYTLTFPNNQMNIKLSGNYVIKIFKDNPNKPIITKRFAVYEPVVRMQAKVLQGFTDADRKQTVSFSVFLNRTRFDFTRNIKDLWATVVKNYNWNETLYSLTPDFTDNEKIIFNHFKNTFWAGNEYRWFDTKKIDAKALNTEHIERDSIFNHYLRIDKQREDFYLNEPDYNGNYYIRTVEFTAENNIDSQADYAKVHFTFGYYNPKDDVDIYVTGAFNDWQLTPQNRMTFDPENRNYHLSLLLKQGTYNYQYTFTKKGTEQIIVGEPEGNYWQTTNLYTVLLYYRPWGQRYDLLLGETEVLSRE